MNPRQARRERREAERKAKKLELKKGRLAENHPLAAPETFPEIQPRWNPELEDEFPREVQIRNNAMFDRRALELGLPIPPPGPTAGPRSDATSQEIREFYHAQRKAADAAAPKPQPPAAPAERGLVSPGRLKANRANAQLSTGPRSKEGKLASSRNATTHGLASGQLIVPGEDPAAFEALLNNLVEEHQPATSTESLLLEEMAQSFWLTQRAIRLQNDCFTPDGVDQKRLALLLRYQTTHGRRFHKALDTLLKLRKIGFVSRKRAADPTPNGFVSQNATATRPPTEFVSQNVPQAPPESTPERRTEAA